MADSEVINLLYCLWTFQNLSIASLFCIKSFETFVESFISCNMVTAWRKKRTFQQLLLLFFEFIFVNVWSIKFHQFKGFMSVLAKLCRPLAYSTLLSAGIKWRKWTLISIAESVFSFLIYVASINHGWLTWLKIQTTQWKYYCTDHSFCL